MNILLAEDEKTVAVAIEFALRAHGHRIEVAVDGEKALARICADPTIDLLVTDHNMPRMTGIELVRRARECAFAGRILVLSAHLSAENRAAYTSMNVNEMMSKPFDVEALRSAIRTLAN
ncbi:MAG: two-component system, chemotaxis family, chemotaxis protein CheY [Verrucomicrobiota bacterium]